MQINIDLAKLKDKQLLVCTPMYGGQCSGIYTQSVAFLLKLAAQHGLNVDVNYLFNESLITRARNYCVDEFLRRDWTHMIFIDSDIAFSPKDVIAMWYLAVENEDYHVVTGPYPKKTISWEKIVAGVDKGVGRENPTDLQQLVGDYVFNPADGSTSFRIDEPVKVKEAGTGFMLIPRETFIKYQIGYPELMYKPDHIRTEHFNGDREIMAFFDCVIDPDSKRYLSEDYFFCYNVRKLGMNVIMCPWMQLHHHGSYIFNGNLAAIAYVGSSPTADESAKFKPAKPKIEPTTTGVPSDGPVVKPLNRKERRKLKAEKKNS